jgi:hypothetical protein
MIKSHNFTPSHLVTILWIIFGIFLYNETSVEIEVVKMILRFLKVDRGELNINKHNSIVLRSGQSIR